jgi:ubiquinone/menaquinone biosynthesis C-methylase UbiE
MLAVGVVLLVVGVAAAGWIVSRRPGRPCPARLSWLVELDNPIFRNNRASTVIEALQLTPGMRVLDVGCGPGRFTIPLSIAVGPSGQVTALDVQNEMLTRVQEKARQRGLENIVYLNVAADSGALQSEQFDRSVLATVLGEIPQKLAALQEIYRALKPHGILAITELIADPHFQSQGRVRALAHQAGFRELRTTGTRFSYTMYLERP